LRWAMPFGAASRSLHHPHHRFAVLRVLSLRGAKKIKKGLKNCRTNENDVC
jgi:hypothetical protein